MIDTFRDTFKGCKSFVEKPDISWWDTNRVSDMSGMFEGWESLTKLSDIEKWEFREEPSIEKMLKDCTSLQGNPHIKFKVKTKPKESNKTEEKNNKY